MILTLTINPALDRIITADRLVFEDRGYILDRSEAAGGRGINASQVIHSFGGKTAAVLTTGGVAGERLEKLLGGLGFPYILPGSKSAPVINPPSPKQSAEPPK